MSIGTTALASGGGAGGGSSTTAGLGAVDIDQFLTLMIAELRNQDPLNPMDNSQMLQQISQIRSIGATDKLTSTLEAVLTGQNLSTASNMIGKQVRGGSVDGRLVEGKVESVSVERNPKGGTRLLVQVEGHATAASKTENVNAQLVVTSKQAGEGANGTAIVFLDDKTLPLGGEFAAYDPVGKSLLVQINPGVSTARDVLRAIEANAAASEQMTVRLAGNGEGLVEPEHSTILSSGGRQSLSLDNVREILPGY